MADKKGVTLIELVMAIVLIAIVSGVSMEFLGAYQRMALKNPKRFTGTNFARQKMEALYMNAIGSWTAGSDTPTSGVTRSWSNVISMSGKYYTVKVIVQTQ